MKWLGKLVTIVLMLGLGLYGLYLYNFPEASHRYRLTVEIEADGKVHSGTGVVDVLWFEQTMSQVTVNSHVKGRAALVDLGKHGVVIAALNNNVRSVEFKPVPRDAEYLALEAFYGRPTWATKKVSQQRKAYKAIGGETGRRSLPEASYPPFIWLPNPADRGSAEPMMAHDFPRKIDPSVKIRSVTVEMTNDPFDNNLFEKLPWLEAAYIDERANGLRANAQVFKLYSTDLMGKIR